MTELLLAFTFFFGPSQVAAIGSCPGAALAIASVIPFPPTTAGGDLNHYRIDVTVQNRGSAKQPGNALDSVAMYQNGVRSNVKGLKPLAAGGSQTVSFTFARSAVAGRRTSRLRFQLLPARANAAACGANTTAFVRV